MQGDALPHAFEAKAVRPDAVGIEAAAVVLHHSGEHGVTADEQDTHLSSLCVLDDVRERFLDDAVHRRLHLRWEPLLADSRLQVDVDPTRFRERLHQPFQGRDQPEVVKRFGPQLHGEPPDILQCCDDEFTEVGEGALDCLAATGIVHGTQA